MFKFKKNMTINYSMWHQLATVHPSVRCFVLFSIHLYTLCAMIDIDFFFQFSAIPLRNKYIFFPREGFSITVLLKLVLAYVLSLHKTRGLRKY